MSVVVLHLMLAFDAVPRLIDLSPLHILWAGHEAVVFFFVLSGFVLALPFVDGQRFEYGPYAIKRLLRIYLPYAVATAVALGLAALTTRRVELGPWFDNKWTDPPTARTWLDHLLVLGNFNTSPYNPAIWSLVHELRISIIFPGIVWLVRNTSWRTCAAVGFIGSGIGAANLELALEPSLGWHTSFCDSAHFAVMFLVGASLARHRVALVDWFRGRSRAQIVGLWTLALTSYAYGRGVRMLPFASMRVLSELGIALGVVIILLGALSSERLARALSHRWLVYNGTISYSLYLWHSVVLFAACHFLVGRISNVLVVAVAVVGTIAVTVASHRWLEVPSIAWGRAAASGWSRAGRGATALPVVATAERS